MDETFFDHRNLRSFFSLVATSYAGETKNPRCRGANVGDGRGSSAASIRLLVPHTFSITLTAPWLERSSPFPDSLFFQKGCVPSRDTI